MRRLLVFALAASLLTAFLGMSSGTAAAAPRLCKNTYGGDVIRASKDLKCSRARAVVRAWAAGYKEDGQINRPALGFNCAGRNDPYEGLTVTCRGFGKRVSFYANVP